MFWWFRPRRPKPRLPKRRRFAYLFGFVTTPPRFRKGLWVAAEWHGPSAALPLTNDFLEERVRGRGGPQTELNDLLVRIDDYDGSVQAARLIQSEVEEGHIGEHGLEIYYTGVRSATS